MNDEESTLQAESVTRLEANMFSEAKSKSESSLDTIVLRGSALECSSTGCPSHRDNSSFRVPGRLDVSYLSPTPEANAR